MPCFALSKYHFWLFALFLGGISCEPSASPQKVAMPDGKAIYRQYCTTCHGADGTLGLNGAGDLTKSVLTPDERVHQIAKGKNLMMPYEGILAPAEIKAVAQYIETLRK